MSILRRILSSGIKAFVALGILILGISAYNYLVATKPEKPLQPRLEKVWTVEVATIDFQVAFPKKSSFGQVEASRKSRLNLTSPVKLKPFPISSKMAVMSKKDRN